MRLHPIFTFLILLFYILRLKIFPEGITLEQLLIMTIDHLPGRTLRIDGEEYLFFSGTSYLGMGQQPEFRAALTEGMARYGTIFSASRNNNLQLDIYEKAENFIAEWTGAEAALTVTSGLLAGQLAVQSLDQPYQRFIYAPSVHPAIWREKPTFCFENYEQFSNGIIELIIHDKTPVTICCNAIDPLKCTLYDFSWIAQLPDNQDITLIFDDSHAIGIQNTFTANGVRQEGVGNYKKLKKLIPPSVKFVVIASLAKAVGIPGGVILSDLETIKTIRQNPLFVGASPIVPAYLYAFLTAQNVYAEARIALKKNIDLFNKLNASMLSDFKFYDHYPVFYTSQNDLYPFLLKHKTMISSFSYPNPSDTPITRIILSALHTEGDIEVLSGQLSLFLVKSEK